MPATTTTFKKSMDHVRRFLSDEVAAKGRNISLKSLSTAIGKNPAYLHQFIHRGSPRHLPEDIRHQIAALLGVSEINLRHHKDDTANLPSGLHVIIPFHDHPSQHDHAAGPWHVPQNFLQDSVDEGHVSGHHHNIRLAVVGDNTPDFGITRGDIIMMDRDDCTPLRAGYFALDAGPHIRVRHLEQVSASDPRIIISGSDTQSYSSTDLHNAILGRVIFKAQIFSSASHTSSRRLKAMS